MPTPLAGPRQALIEAMQGRLGFALLTSVGLHLAVFATLMPFGARPQGGVDSSRQGVDSQMKVVLAPTREDAPAARNDARPPPASLPERRVADAREAARAVQQESENAASADGPLAPRVIVSDAVPRARLGEHVEQYMLRAFPVEIEEPVRIKSSLRVLFPSTALHDRREDTVVVWVIVRADGTVDEIHVVEGAPEFLDAVTEVVAPARFRPAKNAGQAIRFPITLEFTFRLAPLDPAGSAAGIAAAR